MKLSILMPVYGEARTLDAALRRVLAVDYGCDVELVVVDDGSKDDSHAIAARVADTDSRVSLWQHPVNQGKGAAIKTAVQHATGDWIIICDADLEYAPEEIPLLLAPLMSGDARDSIVYGTRAFTSNTAFSFWYVMGNKTVTMTANILYDAWISDLETCFKLLPLALYRELDIVEKGFGMEAEVTAKLLRRGLRPYEVPITYRARSREEGKKITAMDGVEALWILARLRFTKAGLTGATKR